MKKLTYYDCAEDKIVELTQPVLDQMQHTGLMQFRRNMLIMKIANMHIKRDEETINKLCNMVGIA